MSSWVEQNDLFYERELKKIPDGILLLDLGAGPGQLKGLMTRFKRIAVDFQKYEGIDIVADITKQLPFEDNTADVIVLSRVLEHISEPNATLKECERVLKPKGLLLGTVPFKMKVHQKPYDYFRYTDICLRYLLGKHNFTAVKVNPFLDMNYLFRYIGGKFFLFLITETKFSENQKIQKIYVVMATIARMSFKLFFKIFNPIFKKCYNNPDFPIGYSFKAQKKF